MQPRISGAMILVLAVVFLLGQRVSTVFKSTNDCISTKGC